MTTARILNLALLLTATLLALAGVFTIGPAWETRFNPAYSKFQIASVRQTPDGGSLVTFTYTKLRACEPLGFRWFIGEPGAAFRQLEIVSDRPTGQRPNRPIGTHTSVEYKVDVTPEALVSQGFASIYSNCHPFWVTRSVIYP